MVIDHLGREKRVKEALNTHSLSQLRVKNALTARTSRISADCARADTPTFCRKGKGLAVRDALRFDLNQSRRLDADRRLPVSGCGAGIVNRCDVWVIGDHITAALGAAMTQLNEAPRIAQTH
jgi:hypothetical protein